jgi:hypothetical protein
MYLLFHNVGGYIQEQVRFARRQYGFNVFRNGPIEQYQLGDSPFLLARHVFNFEVRSDENGDEIATWEDHEPIIDNAVKEGSRGPAHFWKRKRTYRKSTKEITCEAPVREEYRFYSKRKKKGRPTHPET